MALGKARRPVFSLGGGVRPPRPLFRFPRVPAPSRRQLAAVVAARFGLLGALSRVRRQPGLVSLAYHRIGEAEACPVDDQLVCASAAELRDHIRIIQRWARAADLEQVEAAYAGGSFDRPLVLLTFDDVYRDNYETAFPILRDAEVPAVFFVPTGLIEAGHVPWWDRIAYAVKHAREDSLSLTFPERMCVRGLKSDTDAAVLTLLRVFKRNPDMDKERFVAGVEAAAGASALRAPGLGELFASWSELRTMAREGMILASHTHSHRLLSHLSPAEQREELARSRDLLREHTRVETRAVAYPVGARDHFNADTRAVLAELGYRLGFSHYGGWNASPADPYDIRRVRMDRTVSREQVAAGVALPAVFIGQAAPSHGRRVPFSHGPAQSRP